MNVETPSLLDLILNFYGYYVPFILLAIWAPMALIDLAKRKVIAQNIPPKHTYKLSSIFSLKLYLNSSSFR